jgi:hypothetical protein
LEPDTFRVYEGKPSKLTGYDFAHILRDPGCFYFFNISCLSDANETILRRDLCWLTGRTVFFLFIIIFRVLPHFLDPVSPTVTNTTSSSFHVQWEPVRFCGISRPEMINSITFTLEVSEGVDWKENALAKYMNDNIAYSYKPLFRGKNITHAVIDHLKPAKWYHVRLVVDYLGIQVMSESASFHTMRAPPSTPGTPRMAVVPVRNSFDPNSHDPARLDMVISWNAAVPNGYPIEKYQVHLKRFDTHGKLLFDEPPLLKKKMQNVQLNPQKSIGQLIKTQKGSNQWTASPGKSEIQIRNSLSSRSGFRSRSPSPDRRTASPGLKNNLSTSSFAVTPGNRLEGSQQSVFQSEDSVLQQGNTRRGAQTWKIIYDNLNRHVKLFSPREGDGEWWIRVRAKNNEGWSNFSNVLMINHYNFPTLFPVPMTKEVEHHNDEYYQYFYPANSPNHPQNHESQQLPASVLTLAPLNYRLALNNNANNNNNTASNNNGNNNNIGNNVNDYNDGNEQFGYDFYNAGGGPAHPNSMNMSTNQSRGQSRSHDAYYSGVPDGLLTHSHDSFQSHNNYLKSSSPSHDDHDPRHRSHLHVGADGYQFQKHYTEEQDSFKEHQDKIGLFWDHKDVTVNQKLQKPINLPPQQQTTPSQPKQQQQQPQRTVLPEINVRK